MRNGSAALAVVVVVVGAACGDDPSPGGGTPSGPLSAEASAFVADFCALTQACCSAVEGAAAKCTTETDAFGRGKAFDANKGKACLDGLRAAAQGSQPCSRTPDLV